MNDRQNAPCYIIKNFFSPEEEDKEKLRFLLQPLLLEYWSTGFKREYSMMCNRHGSQPAHCVGTCGEVLRSSQPPQQGGKGAGCEPEADGHEGAHLAVPLRPERGVHVERRHGPAGPAPLPHTRTAQEREHRVGNLAGEPLRASLGGRGG